MYYYYKSVCVCVWGGGLKSSQPDTLPKIKVILSL